MTDAFEVVSFDAPDHDAGEPLGHGELCLEREGLVVIVADPVLSAERVRYLRCCIPVFWP